MSTLNAQSPIGQWVARRPETARLFEELRLDYCCGGDRPLEQVCREQGLDCAQVAARLEQLAVPTTNQPAIDWTTASLSALCDHIEATHHQFLKTELPRLDELILKVQSAHGAAHSELNDVRQVFARLRDELEPHMMKEERILFPAIRQLEQSGTTPRFPFGSVANPIRMMEHEHGVAGNALKEVRRLTDDYTRPDDACAAYESLLNGLSELERDLHRHIHKENSILFPRAIAIESNQS